jgi:hypothetical protein
LFLFALVSGGMVFTIEKHCILVGTIMSLELGDCHPHGLKTGGNGFSRFGFKTGDFGFSSLGLKTSSYSLVILVSKSPRLFLSLSLKIKWATICRLRHKTDGRIKTA